MCIGMKARESARDRSLAPSYSPGCAYVVVSTNPNEYDVLENGCAICERYVFGGLVSTSSRHTHPLRRAFKTLSATFTELFILVANTSRASCPSWIPPAGRPWYTLVANF